jgi:uncharacterized repeat protein (TIGR03806 family)
MPPLTLRFQGRATHPTAGLLLVCTSFLAGCGESLPAADPEPVTVPAVSGLQSVPNNTSCLAPARPVAAEGLEAVRIFPNLSFRFPLQMLQRPHDASRWYVVEHGGQIHRFTNAAETTETQVFADLRDRVLWQGEAGLLGMSFHPDFPADPRVFISYVADGGNGNVVIRVAEYRSTNAGDALDLASERILISAPKTETLHSGGHLEFGADGYLYVAIGDGELPGNPAQDLTNIHGKILRLDINTTPPAGRNYSLPRSNPLPSGEYCGTDGHSGSSAACGEIFAWGFRHPWKFSFDRENGTLWAGDVGASDREELNRVEAGRNYGWRCMEGASSSTRSTVACSTLDDLTEPFLEYGRDRGSSITGGYVYRGSRYPALKGRYVFGDYVTGRIWSVDPTTKPAAPIGEGGATGLNIASFSQDSSGELFTVAYYAGSLHAIRPSGDGGSPTVPERLSDTGCVSPNHSGVPATGLIGFAVNAELWSDGASKERFFALPNGAKLNTDGESIELPAGAVLLKNFRLGGRLVETRLLMRHTDGLWAGYSYEWSADGSDARRVIGGKSRLIDGVQWQFPSEAECIRCHTAAAGTALGFKVAQLNGPHRYPNTDVPANQLEALSRAGVLQNLSTPYSVLPKLVSPLGEAGTLQERAKAYLDANCSHCHRPGGGTPTDLDLRGSTPLERMNACRVGDSQSSTFQPGSHRLTPGSPSLSTLIARMSVRGPAQMPPLGTTTTDTAGIEVVSRWIGSLTACP